MSVSTINSPVTGTYRIDPGSSSIEFTTRHMFGLGKVVGSFSLDGGSVTVADTATDSSVSATASAASFATDKQRRDEHVKSPALLDVVRFPEIEFRSTGLVNEGSRWTLRGELTAHGVTAPVEFVVTELRSDPTTFTVRATGTVDRYAHGITKVKGLAGRHITLDVTVHAVAN